MAEAVSAPVLDGMRRGKCSACVEERSHMLGNLKPYKKGQ